MLVAYSEDAKIQKLIISDFMRGVDLFIAKRNKML